MDITLEISSTKLSTGVIVGYTRDPLRYSGINEGFSEWIYPVNIGDWQFAVSAAKPVVPVTDTRF